MPLLSTLLQAWTRWSTSVGKPHLLIAFAFLWTAKEVIAYHVAGTYAISKSPARFAIVAGLKLLILSGYYVWQQKRNGPPTYRSVVASEEGRTDVRVGGVWRPTSWVPFVLMLIVANSHAILDYLLNSQAEGTLQPIYHVVILLATALLPMITYGLSRSIPVMQLQGVLLQSCGFLFVLISLFGEDVNIRAHSLSLAAFTVMVFVSTDHLYSTHPQITFGVLNIPLFIMGVVIHSIVALVMAAPTMRHIELFSSGLPPFSVPILFLMEALSGILGLAVIFYHGATTLAIVWSLSAAAFLTWSSLDLSKISLGYLAASSLVVFGAFTFLASANASRGEHEEEHTKNPRWKTLLIVGLTAIGALSAVTTTDPTAVSLPKLAAPHRQLASSMLTCRRKPLQSQSFYDKPRTYHHFENVLLIVFFSHARYGANLDYYKEVYSEYFPNMVFIGPASREDAGFSHSYDLMVDSYQSDEDLSNHNFYKMAGRMAHHMLYTAMMEHNCYDGYLWAPFDTLLNIPRLQLFDQTKFWYYSPWGKIVPNPQVKADEKGEKHAPSARISPDPSLNVTASWRGWAKDWWWGDPHVGSAVCMEAFNKAPEAMRLRMASFTEGKTRLIGGSADTVYIPGGHRDNFMDILALFLETDCFLEIAVPTTIHLVVPPNEDILYLDHWWIWEPPFNAAYVRQRWKEGYEVDTFHTFHWGEKDESGVWRGNHDHVADIQHLQRESALRQGLLLD